MSKPACIHPFHDDPPQGEHYQVGTEGMAATGYRCPTCGFETVRIFECTPATKTCAGCGAAFTGAAEIGDERCDDCFAAELSRYLAESEGGQ
jgi:DNA-directed RNA polymerase subunit RPC12/RpoP